MLSVAAKKIPGALKRKGWSQRQLERELGCGTGYVTHIIRGRREPSARLAARIELLLGIDATLWGKDAKPRRAA